MVYNQGSFSLRQKFYMEKIYLKKINEVEGNEQ
jgi:hypothetical protein